MVGTPPATGRRAVRAGQAQPRSPTSWACRRRPAGRWYARWRDGGVAGMRTAPHGKPARLGPAELARVRRMPERGPVAAGFDTDVWTLARVAEVIERTTWVVHHPGHVWRILRAMGWSSQRPARQAAERDEMEIAQWVAESSRISPPGFTS
jgi:transposase